MGATKITITTSALAVLAALFLLASGAGTVQYGRATVAANESVQAAMAVSPDVPFAQRLAQLRAARLVQERALQDDVADTYGWTRLARLRLATQGDRKGALAALRLSQFAAPYEPSLLVERATAFYHLRDLHTDSDRSAMAREWRYAFFGDRVKLMPLLKTYPTLVPEVDRAMADDEEYAWWKTEREKAGL